MSCVARVIGQDLLPGGHDGIFECGLVATKSRFFERCSYAMSSLFQSQIINVQGYGDRLKKKTKKGKKKKDRKRV